MPESGEESKFKEIVIHKEGSSFPHFQCPVFKSTNYMVWAIHMKTILRANGLWEMIKPKTDTQLDEKKDMSTTEYLFQALPEEMILQVAGCKSAKEIWDALKTRHVGVDRVQKARLQTLKTEFELQRLKEEDTIDTFTALLNGIVTRASGLGSTFDQPTLVRKLLSSVPKQFVQIVATIEQFADLETTTLDEIIGRLKAFEERTSLLNEGIVDSQDKLLFARRDNKSDHGKCFGNRGQGRYNSSRGNWCDEKIRQGKREGGPSYDNFKRTRDYPINVTPRLRHPLDVCEPDCTCRLLAFCFVVVYQIHLAALTQMPTCILWSPLLRRCQMEIEVKAYCCLWKQKKIPSSSYCGDS